MLWSHPSIAVSADRAGVTFLLALFLRARYDFGQSVKEPASRDYRGRRAGLKTQFSNSFDPVRLDAVSRMGRTKQRQ
jgi:hypothetical protein